MTITPTAFGRSPITLPVPGRRPVISVVDEQHRDPTVARDAVDGRFTHAGTTLDLGLPPDWIRGGTDDEEWRIEWVKSYESLHLAHAFETTANRVFADTWTTLVRSFCEQVTVGYDSSDVSARRIQNWLYAWQRFEAADPTVIDIADSDALTARILADVEHLEAHLTPERNHRTMELYTLLLVGIAFEDRARATRALDLLADNAERDILDDGVQRERSSDYHMIVLRSLVGAIVNARAADFDVPDMLLTRTDAACTFGLHLQRPDGITPALSDGDQGDFRPLLGLAADALGRPDLHWVATGGTAGRPPARRHANFPIGGYVTQRSGWGDDGRPYRHAAWAVLDCGPLGDGGHGHYDQLSVELFAAGRPIVVDPGRYTYDVDDDGWRHWFKGTAAHNTVTVDGLDQMPFRPGKPKGPQPTARMVRRHTRAGLDVVVAQAHNPYHDAVHTRSLVLVDDRYWIIVDELTAASVHRYVARWHLDATATVLGDVEYRSTSSVVRTSAATLTISGGTASITPGWVSPTYGIKHPAPIIEVDAALAASATVVTVVLPGASGPVDVTTAVDGGAVNVVVRHRTFVDVVAWSDETAGWERSAC